MNPCGTRPIGNYLWDTTSPSFLGGYRPNQAIDRGIYRAYTLGQDTAVNLPTLALGIAALGAAFFLLGGKTVPKYRQRRIRRLRRKLTQLEAGA